MIIKEFKKEIYSYYVKHGRIHLPWRKTTDPYKILVSEIMLQQTQVERVIPKYKAFLKKFPTIKKLARATNSEVLALWSGLGYNRRAVNLKRAAEIIVKNYKGIFPKTKEELDLLPGVGPYTAGAICAFAYNTPEVFIETNIRTVFIHFFFKHTKKVSDKDIFLLIEKMVDIKNPKRWYSALMDYGSMLKIMYPNPSKKSTQYARQSRFKGSIREVRGSILRILLKNKKGTIRDFKKGFDVDRVTKALEGLIKDSLIEKKGAFYFLK